MSNQARQITDGEYQLNTLLSPRVLMPISCQCCNKETEVSYETLLSSSAFMCEHCYQVQPLSKVELDTIQIFLAKYGYRMTGS